MSGGGNTKSASKRDRNRRVRAFTGSGGGIFTLAWRMEGSGEEIRRARGAWSPKNKLFNYDLRVVDYGI